MHPYAKILKEELAAAMGCTEPIAIAYATALARQHLGMMPDRVSVSASGNIIKNVKSVIVPNTGGLHGIEAAAAAGIVMGNASLELEVLSRMTSQSQADIRLFLASTPIHVEKSNSDERFEIDVTLYAGEVSSRVVIRGMHTNVVLIQRSGQTVYQKSQPLGKVCETVPPVHDDSRRSLTVKSIVEYADSADLSEVKDILERQIACNMAIADEGLRGDYGANIGNVLLDTYGTSILVRARAKAAAGSDARMNGCEMPVIINSGSGNQGITVCVPVVEYAHELKCPKELLYRALIVSNLCAIHLKSGIGCLSAYCGAVTAGAAAGAGIAYLNGGKFDAVSHTLVNALAITSGIICDGAKASCAAKIAASVDAGILGWCMFRKGQEFHGGDGIVTKGVEATIQNVSRLGHDGMRETDEEIIRMMLGPS